CEDANLPLADGASCGAARTCFQGTCIDCDADGGDCLPGGDHCATGIYGCASGVPACDFTGVEPLLDGLSCGLSDHGTCSGGHCICPVGQVYAQEDCVTCPLF